jgi:hypothetical protein
MKVRLQPNFLPDKWVLPLRFRLMKIWYGEGEISKAGTSLASREPTAAGTSPMVAAKSHIKP